MSPLISGLTTVASLVFNAVSSGSGKSSSSASSRHAGEGDAGGPAALLSLSPEAATLAGFADKGVLMTQGRLDQPLGVGAGTTGRTGQGAARALAAGGGSVSKKDFQELLAQFGATDGQKEALAARFDVNNDGRISDAEFAKGLAQTRGAQSTTDFSQALMQLMDKGGNADGTVGQQEFATFSTAFANAEKRGATGRA
ncbi:EF-hand domain-containing protein [Acidovorax sp.]|uniref:EF-hand domain-containing protein n=1 Tax=Acidovorax sp. TaxID=1872122 RepID=UPI00391898E2